MDNKKSHLRFLNKTTFSIGAVVLLLLLALCLLWHGNANSKQAIPALVADIYFDGEYRIGEGEWQKIEQGRHIPSTDGEVRLRGQFHSLAPDGEYIGIYTGDLPIALYTDHIGLTFFFDNGETYTIDAENPLYGSSACGACWTAHFLPLGYTGNIEILIQNPHRFGNETAVDELLSNLALWSGLDFEKEVLNRGEAQRDIGLFFVIVSFLVLGTALFSTLTHVKNSKIIWLLGSLILLAGIYISYSAEGVSLWSESVFSNTSILGISIMLYMLFLSMAIVYFLKSTGKAVFIIYDCDRVFGILCGWNPSGNGMTNVNPFHSGFNWSTDQPNKIFSKTVCIKDGDYSGWYLREYAEKLKEIYNSDWFDHNKFMKVYQQAYAHYSRLAVPSVDFANMTEERQKFSLTDTNTEYDKILTTPDTQAVYNLPMSVYIAITKPNMLADIDEVLAVLDSMGK
jgi:hypothetical protein